MSDVTIKAAGLAHATQKLLEKQAAEKAEFAAAVETTVDELIKAGSAKKDQKDALISSITENPAKALEVMSKLAESNRDFAGQLDELKKTAAEKPTEKPASTLGTPDDKPVEKKAAAGSAQRESDRVWEEAFKA